MTEPEIEPVAEDLAPAGEVAVEEEGVGVESDAPADDVGD